MSCEAGITASLKGQLSKFSGIIFKGFKKPKQKLIHEMVYGIQAAKDVKLSNISRTLKEDQALIKTAKKSKKRGQIKCPYIISRGCTARPIRYGIKFIRLVYSINQAFLAPHPLRPAH